MMRIKTSLIVAIVAFCIYSIQSCKKSDPAPTPVPTVKPDTLSAGWTKQVIAGETNFSDVFFNSQTTGYLTGSKVYKSTDGGNLWNVTYTNSLFNNIFVTNDGKAFFVQNPGYAIYKTIDGGVNFSNIAILDQPTDVFFIDNVRLSDTPRNGPSVFLFFFFHLFFFFAGKGREVGPFTGSLGT